MNIAVMLSVQPKWCELIANGKKTVEIRKTKPQIKSPFKCYIYCTKDKDKIFWQSRLYRYIDDRSHNLFDKPLNGKVFAEFVCDFIELIEVYKTDGSYDTPDFVSEYMLQDACLNLPKAYDYANGKILYGWHISDLVIYDVPKELKDFSIEDKTAIKNCKHRFRTGQPESVTKHGGWIQGGFGCMKSGIPEWCENCLTKTLTSPPQSWRYVEELK